jgi:hypothetical protein
MAKSSRGSRRKNWRTRFGPYAGRNFSDRLSSHRDKISAPGYQKVKHRTGATTQLTVFSEVHPEIDVAKLIDALNDYRRSRP